MAGETMVQLRARLNARRQAQTLRRAWSSGLGDHALILALLGLAAFALLVLAVPRIIAQAVLLPHLSTLENLQSGVTVSAVDLSRLREALKSAHRFDETDGRILTDQALVELVMADRMAEADWARRPLLESAADHLRQGLRLAPVNSFAWARLAGVHIALEGKFDEESRRALAMSYATGPFADKIMPFRAGVTLAHWDSLDGPLKHAATRELIYLWERRGRWADNQRPLIDALCRTGRVGVLANGLIAAHRDLREFDALYATHLNPQACSKKLSG